MMLLQRDDLLYTLVWVISREGSSLWPVSNNEQIRESVDKKIGVRCPLILTLSLGEREVINFHDSWCPEGA
jgi:hypothetical protein